MSFMLRAGWHECVDADGDSCGVLIADDHSPALCTGRMCRVADGHVACGDVRARVCCTWSRQEA